jgi:hypothetical protein
MMTTNGETFYRVLLLGLLLCVALYAEETVHFLHYGWKSADTDGWISDISKCQRVPGSDTDLECPIRGYGLTRYRYRDRDHKSTGPNVPNKIFLVY